MLAHFCVLKTVESRAYADKVVILLLLIFCLLLLLLATVLCGWLFCLKCAVYKVVTGFVCEGS